MFSFSELYLFSKGMADFPEWARALPYSFAGGHILSILAISPIVFLTSNLKIEIKNIVVVALLVPLIVVFAISLSNEQMFAFIAVNYIWILLVNIIPISIVLIACRLVITRLG